MTRISTLFYFFIFFFVFSACTPLRVVRLDPASDKSVDRMLYGNPVQRQASGDVIAEVSFYDATPKFVVFNLEIENTGNVPFDFDPAAIQLVPDEGDPVQAIDPEMQLFGMDMQNARKQKTQRIVGGIGAGLLIAGAVVSVADNNANTFDNGFTATNLTLNAADLLIFTATDEAYTNRRHYAVPREDIPFPDSRFFWLDHALRVTTVRPGEKVMGKVAFNRFDQATYFDFTLEVDEQDFSFGFYQRVFRP